MRGKLLAALLGVSLALTTMTAYAERPTGDSDLAEACRGLLDYADDLIDEYGNENTTPSRREKILEQLKNIGSTWDFIGCRDQWGDPKARPLPPVRQIRVTDPTHTLVRAQ